MTVRRFKKRPGFIAIQFDGTNDREIRKETGEKVDLHRYPGPNDLEESYLEFGEYKERVNYGDYVYDYYGEWRTSSKKGFEKDYEPLDLR